LLQFFLCGKQANILVNLDTRMRTTLLFFLAVFIVSCSRKKETIQEKAVRRVLTMADLKFPLVDGNSELPNPYKDNLVKNHIKERVSQVYFESYDNYCKWAMRLHHRPVTKDTFAKWNSDVIPANISFYHNGFFDHVFYDQRGNLCKYSSGGDMATHSRYGFDSFGYKISDTVTSCTFGTLNFRFSFDKYRNVLTESIWEPSREGRLASLFKTWTSNRTYQFDTLGYLINNINLIVESDCQYLDVETYTYSSNHNLTSTEENFYCPLSSKSGLMFRANRVTAKYYYTNQVLDSIAVSYRYYYVPDRNYSCTTYYDKRGLPVKTKFSNRLEYGSDCVVYKYVQW